MKPRVYLSRRNLLTLLSKLDHRVAGQQTECTLIKRDSTQREPGPIHDDDTPGRELALAVLKLHGHEYLDDEEYATVEEFLSKYGLKVDR